MDYKENPCDGCTNRKGCITCENGELRETVQEEPKHKFVVGNKIIYLNEEYEIVNITDHYILHTTKRTKIEVLHLAFDNEEFIKLIKEPASNELETSIIEYMNHVPENEPESSNTLYTYEQMQDIARHFAEWQKRQIIKDAVDGEVTHGKSLAIPSLGYFLDKNGLDFGDKVKLIIIKEG